MPPRFMTDSEIRGEKESATGARRDALYEELCMRYLLCETLVVRRIPGWHSATDISEGM